MAADPPALLGLTLLAHSATMVDSSSITPPFLALGWPLRTPALDGDHCSPLLLKCASFCCTLCPCAVHVFGLSPQQTTLRWDVVATQPTLHFIVYWQTPYSAAEHQARI